MTIFEAKAFSKIRKGGYRKCKTY